MTSVATEQQAGTEGQHDQGPRDLEDTVLSEVSDTDLSAMVMIRHFELKLLELFQQGKLHGTTHTCMGQEYVPVALSPLFTDADFVFSNHRGHGHYLARFADPAGLLAEIMGREGAICRGVGGSQHILRDRYLSTGVQGESLPVAAGAALHLARAEPGVLACAYIGDGTWGEGSVYEALNLAALHRLPLLVVVEHNGIAQSTPTDRHMAGSIEARAAAFGVRHQRVDTVDVNRIREQVTDLMDRVRSEPEPAVLEFATTRLGPHSKGDDSRPDEEVARLRARDWYARYARTYPDRFGAIDAGCREQIERIAAEVEQRPLTTWEEST